ncbi:MAG: DMP19 family protein [Acidobacteriota bacterium]
MKNPALITTCALLVLCSASISCDVKPRVDIATKPPASNSKTVQHLRIDDSVIDSKDSFTVIEPVWYSADIYDGEQAYENSLKKFSTEQRYLHAVIWHISEVDNGGHDQFYSNSTGIVWRDALAGYKALGLNEAAAILKKSADLMGGNPSLDRDERQKQLEEKHPDFEELDTQFFKIKQDDIEAAMKKYIKDHRKAFYFEGDVQEK